jgi:acetyltransferase-like isoleucine patch superfamily enzyme
MNYTKLQSLFISADYSIRIVVIGAAIRQFVGIGEYTVVGTSVVVVEDILPGLIVAGVPAYPFREVVK